MPRVSSSIHKLNAAVEWVRSQEAPRQKVPVYITVPREVLPHVLENGLRVGNNQMASKDPELQDLFERIAREMKIDLDRTSCVYAYPNKRDQENSHWHDDGNRVLLEVAVDPSKPMLVTDGEIYAKALACALGSHHQKGTPESWAREYWKRAVSMREYLEQTAQGNLLFESPELLIPFDISPESIKVIH
ncbi:hypothetical protein KJ596_02650 [Patescibacteria group bacterium]|nr:hypothetical protein [Patescibacteria group bacterium]MBU1868691.1 hypothetical protein [Patescibacteria group bacterium]